ncbi:MAG: hypothetical protein OXL37_01500 [Chloroflexota bacterium]|nr:hypothetical protein [Chloroflexota bacterium]MDE2961279.1 hypothetical protein [Chloroflexota bacterium]
MASWIETARSAVKRSHVVRDELREEAKSMLAKGERAAAKRIFDDILEEPVPDVDHLTDAPPESVPTGT